jgi:hypothetical protein
MDGCSVRLLEQVEAAVAAGTADDGPRQAVETGAP